MDCFGDPVITGKNSTDLIEGKCTWITCSMLEKINNKSLEKEFFYKNFAQPEHVEKIRKMISEEGIEQDFLNFQKNTVQDLRKDISTFPVFEIRSLLNETVDQIVNRKK